MAVAVAVADVIEYMFMAYTLRVCAIFFKWFWNPNILACACMWLLIFSKINSLTLQFLNFVIIFVFVEVALVRSFFDDAVCDYKYLQI